MLVKTFSSVPASSVDNIKKYIYLRDVPELALTAMGLAQIAARDYCVISRAVQFCYCIFSSYENEF